MLQKQRRRACGAAVTQEWAPTPPQPVRPPAPLPQHYCLATNVIGSDARGTMKRAVAALKAGYEVPIFPLLDRCK